MFLDETCFFLLDLTRFFQNCHVASAKLRVATLNAETYVYGPFSFNDKLHVRRKLEPH